MSLPTLIRLGSRSSKQNPLRTAGGLPLGITRSHPSARSIKLHSLSSRPSITRINTIPLAFASRSFSSTPRAHSSNPSNGLTEISPTSLPTDHSEAVTTSASETTVEPFSTVISDPSVTDAINTAVMTGDRMGDFAAAGLGGWGPSGLVQTLLEQIHIITGLPWWASVVMLTAMVRIAMFPIHRRVVVNNSRLARVQPEAKVFMDAIKNSQKTMDKAELEKNTMKLRNLYASADASPLKALLGFAQVPVAFAMFFGLKGVFQSSLESIHHGGLAWFTDLTLADPTYCLPILSSAAFIAMLRLSAAETPKQAETRHMTNGFTIFSLFGAIPMSFLPSGVMVYFIANGLMTGLQTAILRLPAIRDRLGILPPLPTNNAVADPSMMETLVAGWKKIHIFHRDVKNQMEAQAMKKLESDLRKRKQEEKQKGKSPIQRLSKPAKPIKLKN